MESRMNGHGHRDGHGSGQAHAGHAPQPAHPGAGHACCHADKDAAAAAAIDPVCGMKVDPQSAAGSHEHAGMKYYFCSAHCLKQFQADPAKYLRAQKAAPLAPAKPGAKYTCPMHPEIIRDAPGDCPICGMALVPIGGTGEADDSELRDLTRRFWIGTGLSIPLIILAMA